MAIVTHPIYGHFEGICHGGICNPKPVVTTFPDIENLNRQLWELWCIVVVWIMVSCNSVYNYDQIKRKHKTIARVQKEMQNPIYFCMNTKWNKVK